MHSEKLHCKLYIHPIGGEHDNTTHHKKSGMEWGGDELRLLLLVFVLFRSLNDFVGLFRRHLLIV